MTNCPQKGTREKSSVIVSNSRKFVNCAWTNGWANNRDTGDSRNHRAHYDVTVVGQMGVTNLDILRKIPFQRCHMSVIVSPITGHLSKQFLQSNIRETSAHTTGPLLGETTGDRWISLTKGQWWEKSFHFMTDVFMVCLFLFPKWFCKELILKSMDDHGRKTYHNDYVTKLTRLVDQYPGNPFVTLRAHPLHPAGGSQLFCTYGVIVLRKRPRWEQRKTAGCRPPDIYRALFVWWR